MSRAGWRGGWGHGACIAVLLAIAGMVSLLAAPRAQAQDLAEYDYEHLGFRALGVDILYANADDAQATVGFGLRADLGFLGPYVRVVPRFAFWRADIEDEAVARFESNLEDLCVPSGACTIDLGTLERNYWVLGLDFQWTLAEPAFAPYLGIGVDAYLLDDSGDAIKGTFLDGAVVTAGLSAVGGLEWDVREHLRLYADVRGTLVTSATNLAFYAGVAYRF